MYLLPSRVCDCCLCHGRHLIDIYGEAAESRRVGRRVEQVEALKPLSGTPRLLLAKLYTGKQKIDGWWMSEKLDGVRLVVSNVG